mmetsp:Transcript_36312/g.75556  ORF Transcript_36312/g.75556 Transcript_36312/m.75556 type:complete len:341 (-) Transcript_36312:603-1625(-)
MGSHGNDKKFHLVKRLRFSYLMDLLLIGAFCMAATNVIFLSQPFENALKHSRQFFHQPRVPEKERNIHFIFGLWEEETDPKTVAQNMPPNFQRNLQIFEDHNPGWKIKKWFSKAEIEEHIQLWTKPSNSTSGGKKRSYSVREAWRVASPVQRADMFRYLMLWKLGGFYFDLDVTCAGNNSVVELMKAVELDPSVHTAALFWERGRLDTFEQYESQLEPVRRGIPEYRTRLANYALWSRPGSKMMKCAIQLATYRIIKVHKADHQLEERIPRVLYSSGPDVICECAFGVRDKYFKGTSISIPQNEDEVIRTRITTDNVLVVDPGPNLVNGNTFSWKNEQAA